jgi:GTPase SAR1 family protein
MESKTKRSFKFALVGEAGCGKTSISLKYVSFIRYMTNIFHDPYPPTVGAMFYQKELIYKKEPISIEIWDTAGEERFAKLASFYYKYRHYREIQKASS